MTQIPLACALPADELRGRATFLESLARDALIAQEAIPAGVRSRFRDSPDVERRLRELVALESACCAFLSLEVGRRNAELWLDVTGAPEARPIIDELFARRGAVLPGAAQPPRAAGTSDARGS
jgi:hypothetical protein